MLLRKLFRGMEGEDHSRTLGALVHAGVTTVPALLQLPLPEVCALADATMLEAQELLVYVSRRVCPAVVTVGACGVVCFDEVVHAIGSALKYRVELRLAHTGPCPRPRLRRLFSN